MSDVTTDIRCPSGSSLLTKVLNPMEVPLEFIDSNLLQLFCKDCSREFRRLLGDDKVQRVLHIFTSAGDFRHTTVQFRDGADKDISLEDQVKIFELNTRFTSRI